MFFSRFNAFKYGSFRKNPYNLPAAKQAINSSYLLLFRNTLIKEICTEKPLWIISIIKP